MVEDWYSRGAKPAGPEEPDQPADSQSDAPRHKAALPYVLIGVGVILALATGVLAFAMTRGSTQPVVRVTPVPAPVVTPPVAAESSPTVASSPAEAVVPAGLVGLQVEEAVQILADAGLVARVIADPVARDVDIAEGEVLGVDPGSGASVDPGTTVRLTAAVAPTASPIQPPSPTPSSGPELVLTPGDPAGAGCMPGSGPLPDGQWLGYIAVSDPTVLRFDLVCFNSTTGAVTNDNTTLRDVPLAEEATVRCGSVPCELPHILPSTLTAIEVDGGVARHIMAGVGTSEPSSTP